MPNYPNADSSLKKAEVPDNDFLNADGSLNRDNVSDIATPALTAAQFVLQPGWDVIVNLRWADDLGYVYLNDVLVATYVIFSSSHPVVSLRNGLRPGSNFLRVHQYDTNPGGQNWWGISYSIGIFDNNGKPAFPLIDIELRGRSSR